VTDAESIERIKSIVKVAGRDPATLTPEEWIAAFQSINGLRVDGQIGQATERVLERPRFCRNPDRVALDAKDKCRWDHTLWNGNEFSRSEPMLLTWHVAGAATGFSLQQTQDAFALALSYWAEVCAIVFSMTPDPSKANGLFEFGRIDDQSSTLAWQELPCGKDTPGRQLKGRYDTAEPWIVSEDPPAQRIDLVRVAAHECGHWLGLDHLAEGALLAPYYDRTIRKPQAADIKEAQLRYGPPIPKTPTPGPGTPPVSPKRRKLVVDIMDEYGTHWHSEMKPIGEE
jgi:hypothetical protein